MKEPAKRSSVQSPFNNLPFDVACSIIEAMDEPLSARRGSVDDTTDNGQPAILSFRAVNKKMHDWAEPYVLARVGFGVRWESTGALRWNIAETRMEQMLQSQKLKKLVKVFRFQWSEFSLPQGPYIWNRFWSLFSHVLVHFSSLESVILDMPLRSSAFRHPPGLRRALTLCNEPDGKILTPVPSPPKKKKSLLPRSLSCFAPDSEDIPLETVDDLLDRLDPETDYALFPSVKNLYLERNSYWILFHCPNLERFMTENPIEYDDKQRLGQALKNLPRLTEISLSEVGHESTVRGLAETFPNVEELSLYPPMITGVSFGAEFCHYCMLDEDQLKEAAPAFKEFKKLRHLAFKNVPQTTLFSKEAEGVVGETSSFVDILGGQSETLEVIQLGEYVYTRHDGWIRHEKGASS